MPIKRSTLLERTGGNDEEKQLILSLVPEMIRKGSQISNDHKQVATEKIEIKVKYTFSCNANFQLSSNFSNMKVLKNYNIL